MTTQMAGTQSSRETMNGRQFMDQFSNGRRNFPMVSFRGPIELTNIGPSREKTNELDSSKLITLDFRNSYFPDDEGFVVRNVHNILDLQLHNASGNITMEDVTVRNTLDISSGTNGTTGVRRFTRVNAQNLFVRNSSLLKLLFDRVDISLLDANGLTLRDVFSIRNSTIGELNLSSTDLQDIFILGTKISEIALLRSTLRREKFLDDPIIIKQFLFYSLGIVAIGNETTSQRQILEQV